MVAILEHPRVERSPKMFQATLGPVCRAGQGKKKPPLGAVFSLGRLGLKLSAADRAGRARRARGQEVIERGEVFA